MTTLAARSAAPPAPPAGPMTPTPMRVVDRRIEHHDTGVPGLSGQIDPEDAHTVNLRRIADGVRRVAGTVGDTIAARTRGRR